MKKHLFFLSTFFFLAPYCFPENSKVMDRLLTEVKNASYYDSIKLFIAGDAAIREADKTKNKGAIAEIHLYYGNYFFYIRNLPHAKQYFELSLNEALSSKASHIETLARIRLCYLDYLEGNHLQAENKASELLEKSKKQNDFDNVAEILNFFGIMCEESGNLNEAVKYYLEGMAFSENHQLKYYPAVFRNNIGIIKINTQQVEEALVDLKEGLVIAEREKNKRLASHIQMNMCLAYVMDNNTDSANILFPKVLEYSRENNLPEELGSNYSSLGTAFYNKGDYKIAINYLDSAITVFKVNNFTENLIMVFIKKLDLLMKIKNLKDAEKVLKEISPFILHSSNLGAISSFYLVKYNIDLSKNNYREALSDYVKYSTLKDSADTQINNKIIKELQFNYKVQQKETELEKERSKSMLLEKSNREEKLMKWIIIASSFILLTLVAVFFYLGYSKKIRKKQTQFSRQLIQNIEDERQRIAMDLHDDIGQSLSIIKSKVIKENQLLPSDASAEIERDLGKVIEQTREISRNLFPSSLAKIGLSRLLAVLMENIQSTTGLECSYDITPLAEQLPLSIQTHLFRIIQECTNNTIKHSGATGLKISISEKSNQFTLIYQDNGKGIKNKYNNSGIGLSAIQERVKMINGTVDIDEKSEKGFTLVAVFKSEKK